MVDADVDAANLYILLDPTMRSRESFSGGHTAFIDKNKCIECDDCLNLCRYQAINSDYLVDPVDCEGCGVCAHFCPAEAIEMQENTSGEWFISDTRYGPFVHAKLGIAEENSGKLVTIVRHNARLISEDRGLDLIIIDGPPGIGCPVIAAVTGTDAVLLVTEPTLSGLHDMQRVAELAKHFSIPAAACINKYDLNQEMSEKIQEYCKKAGVQLLGMVPYDPIVSKALVEKSIIVEFSNGRVSNEIEKVWEALTAMLRLPG
jgi:MinD superfamily P-loop ATPase